MLLAASSKFVDCDARCKSAESSSKDNEGNQVEAGISFTPITFLPDGG